MLQIAESKMTIWNPEVSEVQKNTVVAVGSTCKASKNEEEMFFAYQNWNVCFKGNAYETARKLKSRDRIRVRKGIIENRYDKENQKLYVWCTVFEFENITGEKENLEK